MDNGISVNVIKCIMIGGSIFSFDITTENEKSPHFSTKVIDISKIKGYYTQKLPCDNTTIYTLCINVDFDISKIPYIDFPNVIKDRYLKEIRKMKINKITNKV